MSSSAVVASHRLPLSHTNDLDIGPWCTQVGPARLPGPGQSMAALAGCAGYRVSRTSAGRRRSTTLCGPNLTPGLASSRILDETSAPYDPQYHRIDMVLAFLAVFLCLHHGARLLTILCLCPAPRLRILTQPTSMATFRACSSNQRRCCPKLQSRLALIRLGAEHPSPPLSVLSVSMPLSMFMRPTKREKSVREENN